MNHGDRPSGHGSTTLRLSVTDRCNFRCRYCMPAAGVALQPHDSMLALEELAELVRRLASAIGIRRVKLTGGEPLVRRGLAALVRELAVIEGVSEVSATTNGALLPGMADELTAAGLARVNISLDTLDEQRFSELTRGGRLADTLTGIGAATAAGLNPVKLNSVLLRDGWRADVPRLLDLAAEKHLEVRFIELMRTGTEASWAKSQLVEVEEVRRWLGLDVDLAGVGAFAGPARVETIDWRGGRIRVGWITPQSHPFCASCSRLRLDAGGHLRRCLMDPRALPLAGILARDATDDALGPLHDYLAGKHPPGNMTSDLPMVTVGG